MKIRKYTLSLVLVLLVIGVSSSLAWFIDKDSIVNSFKGSVKIKTEEEFDPPSNWNGSDYTKTVSIKNKGNSDALVRVSIVPRWLDENEEVWSGDTSIVKLHFAESDKWLKGNDGYYYYEDILKKNQSTDKLLETVSLDLDGLSEEEKSKYSNKKLKIDVNSEAVQATQEAVESAWQSIPSDILNKIFPSNKNSN